MVGTVAARSRSIALWWAQLDGTRRAALIVGGTGIVSFLLIVAVGDPFVLPEDPSFDSWHYAVMADTGVFGQVASPFRNRVLVPMVINGLPMPTSWGFLLTASLSIGVAFAAMHRFLTRFFAEPVAWFGLALLATSGLVNLMLANPFYVDSVVLAASAVVFAALAERRWSWVLVVLPVAVAAHDLALLLLVPVGVVAWREKRLPVWLVAVASSLGLWWVLHRSGVLVAANGRSNILSSDHRTQMVRVNAAKYGTVIGAAWAHLIGSYGVGWLLAPFGWRSAPRLVRDGAWMLPFCALLVLNASDWQRMFVPAAPVVIGLSCAAVAGLGRRAAVAPVGPDPADGPASTSRTT